MKTLVNRGTLLLAVLAAFVLSGCSSTKMALNSRKDAAPQPGKGMVLLSLRVENQYKPQYQPTVWWVETQAPGGKPARVWTNRKPFRAEESRFTEQLISLDLPPGHYSLGDVYGVYQGFWVAGRFKYPVGAEFDVLPGSIVYLGHVCMTNREKKEGERASGGVLPLIDQSVTGFSGGTMDIAMSDRAEEDLKLFQTAYPAFQPAQVTKALMTISAPR
jgi:hypothetical protein